MTLSADDLRSLDNVYTVVGFIEETKERYVRHVRALTPRQAEDIAKEEIREKGGVFWVCAVFDGELVRVDTYGDFLDPDMTTIGGI
jgi:hypothetical protein